MNEKIKFKQHIRIMFTHEIQIRVRYGDTDKMGYVYYGNYPYYYEIARAEAIRALGVSYKSIEDLGIAMPVTRMNIKYIQPAFYDDLLTIKVTIPDLPGRIITFMYKVFNEAGKRLNDGESSLIFLDTKTNLVTRAPEVLIEKLKPFFV
jgi:acyl-CoA thioester hydrolase